MPSRKTILYKSMIGALASEMLKIDTAIKSIYELIELESEEAPLADQVEPEPTEVKIASKRFFGMKPRQAAEEFLRIKKELQTAREIAEALLNGGIKTTSKNFSNYMHQTIRVSIDDGFNIFVKKKSGKKSKFGLKEWAKK